MKFGEPIPDRTVTAVGYMVGGAIMAPPVKIRLKEVNYFGPSNSFLLSLIMLSGSKNILSGNSKIEVNYLALLRIQNHFR